MDKKKIKAQKEKAQKQSKHEDKNWVVYQFETVANKTCQIIRFV